MYSFLFSQVYLSSIYISSTHVVWLPSLHSLLFSLFSLLFGNLIYVIFPRVCWCHKLSTVIRSRHRRCVRSTTNLQGTESSGCSGWIRHSGLQWCLVCAHLRQGQMSFVLLFRDQRGKYIFSRPRTFFGTENTKGTVAKLGFSFSWWKTAKWPKVKVNVMIYIALNVAASHLSYSE